jgi:Recombination endonuclease VII
MPKILRVCQNNNCGKSFEVHNSHIERGEGKFCSRQCANEHTAILKRQPIFINEHGILVKQCSQCGLFLPRETEFSHNRNSFDDYAAECKGCNYIRYVEKTYPITHDELVLMQQEQNHVCLLCHKLCSTHDHLSIDHCKYFGVIRGLLCLDCMHGLIKSQYNPLVLRAEAKYLIDARTFEVQNWRMSINETWNPIPNPDEWIRVTATGEREQWCPQCNRYFMVKDNFQRKRTDHTRHSDWCDLCLYFDYIDTKYDLSDASYNELLHSQRYICKICEEKCTVHKMLSVDHDHHTEGMKVRGLLCFDCNLALGCFHDDIVVIERAAEYVERYLIPFLALYLPSETMLKELSTM